jgi:hypothetical protein
MHSWCGWIVGRTVQPLQPPSSKPSEYEGRPLLLDRVYAAPLVARASPPCKTVSAFRHYRDMHLDARKTHVHDQQIRDHRCHPFRFRPSATHVGVTNPAYTNPAYSRLAPSSTSSTQPTRTVSDHTKWRPLVSDHDVSVEPALPSSCGQRTPVFSRRTPAACSSVCTHPQAAAATEHTPRQFLTVRSIVLSSCR